MTSNLCDNVVNLPLARLSAPSHQHFPRCSLVSSHAGRLGPTVLSFLLAHLGRCFTHAQLLAVTGEATKQLAWKLFCLRAWGAIEALGDSGHGKYVLYRVARSVPMELAKTDLRHFVNKPAVDAVEMTPVRHAAREYVAVTMGVATALLMGWLVDFCQAHGVDAVSIRDVLRLGPGSLREKSSLTTVMNDLVALGKVTMIRDGRKNMLKLNSDLPASIAS